MKISIMFTYVMSLLLINNIKTKSIHYHYHFGQESSLETERKLASMSMKAHNCFNIGKKNHLMTSKKAHNCEESKLQPAVKETVSTSISTTCTGSWKKIAGAAVQIAVGPKGVPWVVNSNDNIFERQGSNWHRKNGAAKDIGVGADGTVWVIGTNVESGGYAIYKRNGSSWNKIVGSGVRISVQPDGRAWLVNKFGSIYQYNGSGWSKKTGTTAKDIGVGADGSVWIIGIDQSIQKYCGA